MFSSSTQAEIEKLHASIDALENHIALVMEDGREVMTPKLHPIDKDGLRHNLKSFLKEIEALVHEKWLMDKREEAIRGIIDSGKNSPAQLLYELVLPVIREEIKAATHHKQQSDDFKADITKLIINGQLETAAEVCMEHVTKQAPRHLNDAIHLISELRHYESQERKGLLDQSAVSRARAQIRQSLLELIEIIHVELKEN
jgi:hypothetical protein